MKHLVAFIMVTLTTLLPVSGQSEIVGTWEMFITSDETEDGPSDPEIWQFREDGMLLTNEYSDGELQCVYAFPYTVSGDQVTIGRGLNWEYDTETGEFVLYEDFTDGQVAFKATVSATDDGFSLSLGYGSILRGIVAGMEADEEIGLNAADLGLDYDFTDVDLEINVEELGAALQRIFVAGLVALFAEESGAELDVDLDADLGDVLDALAIALFLAELEATLGVVVDDLETELVGDAEEVITAVFEELGILQSDVDDADQEALREAIERVGELHQLVSEIIPDDDTDLVADLATDFPDLEFVPIEHEIFAPAEAFILPDGRTAIDEATWGHLKRRLSR